MDKQFRHNIAHPSSLSTYLAEERRRSLSQTAQQTHGPSDQQKGKNDYVVLWGLIVLQIVTALIILAILYPFGLNNFETNERAAFDAPSEVEIEWVQAEQPAPTPAPAQPIDAPADITASTPVALESTLPQLKSSSIRIRGLEITQGIQVFNEPENPACRPESQHPDHIFCNNSVPLVAGRHTLLRLYLGCDADCPTTETNVRLRLLKDDQEQMVLNQRLSAAWLPQVNNLPLSDLRLDLDRSLNFKLFPPPAWLSGPITFEIEVNPEAVEEAPAKLSLTKNFIVRKPLRIAYLPIQHQGLSPAELPNLDHWLLRLYPVPDVEYYRLPVPDLVWDKEINKGELLNELLYTYWLYTQHNPAESWPDQLFGWLPQELYNGGAADPAWCPNCAGPQSSRVAFGGIRPEQDIGGPRILVHEIAHNLGAQHAWSPTEQQDNACFRAEGVDIQVDPNWPYDQTPYIQEVGVDVYNDPLLIYPPNLYDMMSYCSNLWISPHTYRKIFASSILQPEAVASLSRADFKPQGPTTSSALLVNGMIYPDGTVSRPKVVHLEGDRVSGQTNLITPPGDDYCLEIHSDNAILARRCFEAGFLNVETGLPTEASPYFLTFSEINIKQVSKISLYKDGQELITLMPSQTPPQIRLTFPNSGETLRGRQTLAWQAIDADGDSLTYDVLYSPDRGQRWFPLATRLKETGYTFDVSQLAASQQALIRVIASDGFYVGIDETDLPFILDANR